MKSIEDIKRSIVERDSAVKKAEDDASDLKNRVENLSKNLDECEKEYQVSLFAASFFFFLEKCFILFLKKKTLFT